MQYLAKAKRMAEFWSFRDTVRMPITRGSALTLNARPGKKQCVLCHTKNRDITPDGGVKINHEAHEEEGDLHVPDVSQPNRAQGRRYRAYA